jgi:hypothetical protein
MNHPVLVLRRRSDRADLLSPRADRHATGTSSAVAHDGCDLGALVLVTTQRATYYEGVTVRCSQVQKPVLASCSQVAAGGDRWLLTAVRGHLGDTGT